MGVWPQSPRPTAGFFGELAGSILAIVAIGIGVSWVVVWPIQKVIQAAYRRASMIWLQRIALSIGVGVVVGSLGYLVATPEKSGHGSYRSEEKPTSAAVFLGFGAAAVSLCLSPLVLKSPRKPGP